MTHRPAPTEPDERFAGPVTAEVLAAWRAAGEPGWATGMLHLLRTGADFDATVNGPRVTVARWRERAAALGYAPTGPASADRAA